MSLFMLKNEFKNEKQTQRFELPIVVDPLSRKEWDVDCQGGKEENICTTFTSIREKKSGQLF